MAKTVMVVDDDVGLQETLEVLLLGEGYHVLRAGNGIEALEQIQGQTRPALILLDLMMPRMNGFELAAELSRRGLRPAIPLVVLTADGRAKEKAEQVGAEGYLAKPFDVPELLEQIDRLA